MLYYNLIICHNSTLECIHAHYRALSFCQNKLCTKFRKGISKNEWRTIMNITCFQRAKIFCRFCYQNFRQRHKGTSSQKWLQRQQKDPYVKRAREENWRCRSAFKLIEIDDKYKLLRPGEFVIDIGAAPGSWTQVACQRTNAAGLGETMYSPFYTLILEYIMYFIRGT